MLRLLLLFAVNVTVAVAVTVAATVAVADIESVICGIVVFTVIATTPHVQTLRRSTSHRKNQNPGLKPPRELPEAAPCETRRKPEVLPP